MAINLLSDTQSKPTDAMRRAIATAEVGDEQRGEDPTVCALQERVAALLGQEAALFLPSGTMCNAIAVRLHIRPGGDEILLDRTAHPRRFEAGGPAAISGAMIHPLDGENGMFTPEMLAAALHPANDRYQPRPRLVTVEQTTNLGGGRVWPLQQVQGVLQVARANGLRAHLDGARLMNAVVASGVDRLADDHARARRLAEGLAVLPGVGVDPAAVETNIVMAVVADPVAFCARLEAEGVLAGPADAGRVRFVTHLDIDDASIDAAIAAARRALA